MAEYIVNGYAYPSISKETLEWWLPRLRGWLLSVYGFTEDGNLINLEECKSDNTRNRAGVRQ